MFLRGTTVGDGVAVIAAADPDPNTTAPPLTRVFKIPSPFPSGGGPLAFLTAEGGSPTVEVWVLQDFTELPSPPNPADQHWFRWGNTTFAGVQDQMTVLSTFEVPYDVFLFLRITAVGGAKRVTLGVTA